MLVLGMLVEVNHPKQPIEYERGEEGSAGRVE